MKSFNLADSKRGPSFGPEVWPTAESELNSFHGQFRIGSMAYLPLHVPWIFKLNVGRYTIPGSHAFHNIWSRKLSQVVASCTTGSLSADASGCTSGKPWQRPRGGLDGTMTFLFCRRVIPLSSGKTNMAMEKKFTIWRCILEKVNLQSLANHVSLLEGYWDFLSQRVLGAWKRQCIIFWFEGNWSAAVRRLVFQLLENVHPFFFGWIELKKIFFGGNGCMMRRPTQRTPLRNKGLIRPEKRETNGYLFRSNSKRTGWIGEFLVFTFHLYC